LIISRGRQGGAAVAIGRARTTSNTDRFFLSLSLTPAGKPRWSAASSINSHAPTIPTLKSIIPPLLDITSPSACTTSLDTNHPESATSLLLRLSTRPLPTSNLIHPLSQASRNPHSLLLARLSLPSHPSSLPLLLPRPSSRTSPNLLLFPHQSRLTLTSGDRRCLRTVPRRRPKRRTPTGRGRGEPSGVWSGRLMGGECSTVCYPILFEQI
jgi:hypothetical protein